MAWVNTEPWTTAPSSPYRPNNPNAWTTNGAQNQTPAPTAATGATTGAGGPQPPVDQFSQAFAGVPWGTFGTYNNWANAYAGQHGQEPNAQAITDYWDSQAFLARNGRPPSGNEWSNRWWTGDWQGRNPWNQGVNNPGWGLLPARYVGGHNGQGGWNAWEPGFAEWSPRGTATSRLYRGALDMPTNLWMPGQTAGFTAWQNYLLNRQPQMNPAPAPAAPTIAPALNNEVNNLIAFNRQGTGPKVLAPVVVPAPAANPAPPLSTVDQAALSDLIRFNRQNNAAPPQMQVYRPPARVGYLRTGW
jgi:hypothetical protein